MDPKLAEIYGTNTIDEADVEKLAAAELAEQLAGDEMSLDGYSEDDLEALAQSVLTDDGDEDESQEKVAEADYLGRVMAHAYVQEMRGIDKEAAARWKEELGMKGVKGDTARKAVNDAAGKQGFERKNGKVVATHDRTIKGVSAKADKNLPRFARTQGKGKALGGKVMSALKGAGNHIRGHKGAYAAGALGAAALGGGAYLAGKSKTSSALDTLIEARVMEILENSGIDPSELEGTEKVSAADGYDVLAGTVEERAWEILGQYGLVPSEE